MLQNTVDFKAKSFLTERNTSTIAYEVKGVRALWDPSLSIPGTNRRGGWRCPIGTRYGGQITDRFGRSCGWGVARRIANQISDIGDRLENVDDARRGRRIARRERRIIARLNPEGGGAGRLERGLRGVAERLDGGDAPSPSGERRRTVVARPPSVDAPETPRELTPAPPTPRAPRRRRAPNLRESEQRRMDREIEQPGAPRTGEVPARRRRRAVVEATKKPKAPVKKPEAVVEPKVVKPRRPKPKNVDIGDAPGDFALAGNGRWTRGAWIVTVDREDERVLGLTATNGRGGLVLARNFNELVERMNAADRRPQPGNSDNAARSEELRQAQVNRARGAGQKVDLNQVLNDEDFQGYVLNDVIPNDRIMIVNDPANFPISAAEQRAKRNEARQRIVTANARLERIEQAIARGELSDNDFIERRQDEEVNIARIKTFIKDYRDAWQEIHDTNLSGEPPKGASVKPDPIDAPFKTPKPVEPIDPAKIAYKQPELDAFGDDARKKMLDDVVDKINKSNLSDQLKKLEIQNAVTAIEELKFHNDEKQAEQIFIQQKKLLEVLEGIQRTRLTRDFVVQEALEEYRRDFERSFGLIAQQRTLVAMKKAEVDAAWELLNRANAGDQAIRIKNLDNKIQSYVEVKKRLELHDRFENDLKNAISRIEQGQVLDESKGTLADKTPDEIVAQVRVDIEKAVEKRGKKLDEYLQDKWKDSAVRPKFEDMTPAKWQALTREQKVAYIKEAYGHRLIKGKNGKFYNAVVSDVDGNNLFEVVINFNEVDKNGNILRRGIATARRNVNANSGSVYQASFFINKDSDKGADIATIFNQHAFLYLRNMGITKAEVGPADDGRYVWGRVGFKTDRGIHTQEQFEKISGALKFYKQFGPGGLIATDEQYFKVKKLLELARGGAKVNHQDFHFAVDTGKDLLEKVRRDYIKQWFAKEVPLAGANLDFGDQKIGAFVSPRNKKKKVTKKI